MKGRKREIKKLKDERKKKGKKNEKEYKDKE